MSRVVSDVSISVDGYAAGLGQTLEKPLGHGPVEERLHAWMFDTPEESPHELGAITAAGAFIMGRNMLGPGRGEWDLDWQGWWGPEPPYHRPVFVLTHHPRDPLEMTGGTTFDFVTDGIESALDRARAAADGGDVAIAGGAATINQYLGAGLLDELRTHVAPVTLGAGERLFAGVPPLELEVVSVRPVSLATHVTHRPRGRIGETDGTRR
ncbi:dihydrofolate reductase family protein [Nocardioides sp. LHG3406-4]|uniref:dihydrofolate reductase family protein n=1 Tax=Nocardioides sp. LHG3406-4 TaxID=2804575 RepID=UPI003CF6B5BB